jgi:predicted RNA binding protein YcfA (HicA-like mRNA interferase family)
MKLPRDLAGSTLVRVLCRDLGYRVVHQIGSHVILETESLGTIGLRYPIIRHCDRAR